MDDNRIKRAAEINAKSIKAISALEEKEFSFLWNALKDEFGAEECYRIIKEATNKLKAETP